MKEKDLFYYMFENNLSKYNEVIRLIQNLEEIDDEGISDEQLLFLRDFYFRLLFRIAVLEYKNYSNSEIARILNLNENIPIFDVGKLKQLKRKFRVILDIIKEELDKTQKNIIIEQGTKQTEVGEVVYIEVTRRTKI